MPCVPQSLIWVTIVPVRQIKGFGWPSTEFTMIEDQEAQEYAQRMRMTGPLMGNKRAK